MKTYYPALFCIVLGISCGEKSNDIIVDDKAIDQDTVNTSTEKPDINGPNILYIFTDDQSSRTVASYEGAYSFVETPNIDNLAAHGVRFRYSYTGAKCVPSRGNALTGVLQHNYDESTRYWISDMKEQGYYTGVVGKWHWNETRVSETWDESAIWEHHKRNRDNYYWDQRVRINGGEEITLDQYSTDYYTDHAVEFITKRAEDPDRPWFYWLCYAGVHGPYEPETSDIDVYADEDPVEIPSDIYGPRPDKPEYMHMMTMWTDIGGQPYSSGQTLDDRVKQYNECVRSIDRGVGEIMEALESTNQLDNTIVIFTSDQGYAWGEHGFRLKIAPYDANLLAPLIFVNPSQIPENKLIKAPVNGTDIIATIQSMSGIQPSVASDGRDMTDILYAGDGQSWMSEPMIQTYTGGMYGNAEIVTELERAWDTGDWEEFVVHKTGIRAWMMLRVDQYKYVRYIYKDYIEELYDLENDPEELVNLAVKEEYRILLRQYREMLLAEFESKGADYLDLLPEPIEVTM